MTVSCYKCGKELNLPHGPVGRSVECGSCGADVHCCLNCLHYDRSSYNDCRENQAERVLDKDRRNYCDFFAVRDGTLRPAKNDPSEARKNLDDLFKK